MKHSLRKTITISLAILGAFIMPVLLVHPHETAAASITCSSGVSGCHFNPSVADGTGRNVPSGQFRGSHVKHAASGSGQYGYACTTCHPNNLTNSHQDGYKDIAGSSLPSNAYSGGNHIQNTDTPSPGTCSNTYCHSTVQGTNGTGAWTSASPAPAWWGGSAVTCGSCHADMSTASGTGTHQKHAGSAAGQYGMACSTCHTGYTASSVTVATHVNNTIEVALASGTYNGGTTPGNHAPGGGYGSCSSNSCHTDGKASPTYVTATWGGSGGCATCHKAQDTYANMGAAATPLTAAHYKHVATDRYGLGTGYTCAACHAETASNNTTILVAGGKHTNGARDWKFGTFGGRDQSGGSYSASACTSTYCHSKGVSTTAPFTAPISNILWTAGAGSSNCTTTCHGGNATAATIATNGPADKHSKHIATDAYNMTCDECHAETTAAASSTVLNATTGYTKHVNGAKDYKFSAAFRGTAYSEATGTYAGSGGACANTYCHSMGTRMTNNPASYPYTGAGYAPYQTANWNGSLTNCNGCHGDATYTNGMPNYTNGTPKANSHLKHVAFTCEKCHYLTTTTGTTVTGFTHHVDANYDVTNQAGTITYAMGTIAANGVPAGGSCSASYCHSTVQGASGVGSGTNIPISWGGSAPGCGGCHLDMSTASGTGSHTKHSGSSTGQYAYACSSCHTGYTSSTVSASAHANATIEVTLGTGTYNGGTTPGNHAPGGGYGSCASNSCHQDGKASPTYASPTWGATGGCGICHRKQDTNTNMAAAGTPPALTAAHYKHVATDRYGLNTAYTCAACHAETATDNATITIAGGKHVNATRDWKFGTFAGLNQSAGSYAASSCTATYCHSKGVSTVAPFTAPISNILWTAGAGSSNCTSTCHGGNATAANVTTNGPANNHVDHIATDTYNMTCAECHAETVAAGSSTTLHATTGYTKHVNSTKDYKFGTTMRGNAAISQATGTYTTGTCANIYCHSRGTMMSNAPTGTTYTGNHAPYQSASWSGTIGCNGCHGSATYTDGRPDYTNGTPKANSHVAHASLSCEKCHYATTTTGTTIANFTHHVDGNYDVSNAAGTITYAMGTITGGIPAGGTCSGTFGCHGSTTWGGAPMNCLTCHSAALGNRRQIVQSGTAADGTPGGTGGDFIRGSRHVSNGTTTQMVKHWDCIVCHMEGNTSDGKTSGSHTGTPNSNADVNLRNVDSYTTGWAWNRLTISGLSAANQTIMRNDMDRFCIACHDSDSSASGNVVLQPNGAAATNTGGTETGVATYYSAVSAEGGTAAYISFTATNLTRTYPLDDISASVTGTITGVTVTTVAKCTSGTNTIIPVVVVGGTTYAGTASTLTTTFAPYSYTWANNPAGGSWTLTAVNALLAGVRSGTYSGGQQVDQVYVTVTGLTTDLGTGTKLATGSSLGGASTIAVNGTNNGMLTGAAVSRRMTPFNTSDTQQNAKEGTTALKTLRNGRGVTDVRGQFNFQSLVGKGWASHHNLNIFEKRYSTVPANQAVGSATATGIQSTAWNSATTTKEGQALNETVGLHCSDCHLNEVNAHGSLNTFYMLQNSSGADTAFTNSGANSSTENCVKCHLNTVYGGGNTATATRVVHNAGSGRCQNTLASASKGQASLGSTGAIANESGGGELTCLGCHGGTGMAGADNFGMIHGSNSTYVPGNVAGGKTKRYRFMNGGSWNYYNPSDTVAGTDASWETGSGTTYTCYTISAANTFGGCTHHGSGTASITANRKRNLQY